MSTARQIVTDLGRALAVFAMLLLCFAVLPPAVAAPAGISATGPVTLSSFCGGHGQPLPACHAPDACCRPDQALLAPAGPAAVPPLRLAAAVAYGAAEAAIGPASPARAGFRPRAPPASLASI